MPNLKFPQINQVAVSGVLANDPEFRVLETGKAQVNFSIAANRSYRDSEDQWQEEITFVPVVAWDKLAEYAIERLQKGRAVFLTGRLKSRKADNASRTVLEIVARNIQFLDKESEEDQE